MTRWFVIEKDKEIPHAGPYLLREEAELLAIGLDQSLPRTRSGVRPKKHYRPAEQQVRFYHFTARMAPKGIEIRMADSLPATREQGLYRLKVPERGVYRFKAPSFMGAMAVARERFGDPAHNSVETRF